MNAYRHTQFGTVIVVTKPEIEQVAEDVQPIRRRRLLTQECKEPFDNLGALRAQVNI